VDARKQRYEHADLASLFSQVERVIVAKGRGTLAFDLQHDATDVDALSGHVLGRSGTLRAPTARVGRTLLVGFSEDAWGAHFGAD
jgi:hypothetical protein